MDSVLPAFQTVLCIIQYFFHSLFFHSIFKFLCIRDANYLWVFFFINVSFIIHLYLSFGCYVSFPLQEESPQTGHPSLPSCYTVTFYLAHAEQFSLDIGFAVMECGWLLDFLSLYLRIVCFSPLGYVIFLKSGLLRYNIHPTKFILFQAYSSANIGRCIPFYNCCHNQDLYCFHPLTEFPCSSLQSVLPSPTIPLCPLTPTPDVFPIPTILPFLQCHINRIIQ